MDAAYEQRGYLHEDWRLFHLSSAVAEPPDWHYHTFHKLIVFLGGPAGYGVEGRSYPLEPGDVVLVPKGCIHRPELAPGAAYERAIVYISPDFLRRRSTADCDLETCFHRARERFEFVVRPRGGRAELSRLLAALERAGREDAFGGALLQDALFLQLLITASRAAEQPAQPVHARVRDEKVAALLQYLAAHLTEPVSIDALAARFYVSKYHMMRRFKAETGYTIHSYLTSKRLMLARERIAAGQPATEVCFACGFRDYSTFARAYRKLFSEPPRAARLDGGGPILYTEEELL